MVQINQKQDRTLATLIHLSVFSQFLIPFGNFIFPVILWSVKKEDPFVDRHGRSALNFQISLFLYASILACVGLLSLILLGANLSIGGSFMVSDDTFHFTDFSQAMPFMVLAGILGLLALGLFVLNIYGVINASLKAGDGEDYQYPLSIKFLGGSKIENASEEKEA